MGYLMEKKCFLDFLPIFGNFEKTSKNEKYFNITRKLF
jgi:hypothetical protein